MDTVCTHQDADTEQRGDLAFFNHSSTILSPNHHSGINDRPSGRQKRKRTSPEDQAVLEQAYKLDSKPDKAKRLELVERVSLDEKEVQIWFQNRRQTSRRKSRPLLPHEIAQYLGPCSPLEQHTSKLKSDQPILLTEDATTEPCSTLPVPSSATRGDQSPSSSPLLHPEPPLIHPETERQKEIHAHPCAENSVNAVHVPDLSPKLDGQIGYLANRRSASSLHQASLDQTKPTPQHVSGRHSESHIRRSTSSIRLSMTSDGKAVINHGPSPSPPKQAPYQSFDVGTLNAPAFQRSSSGRSRDSRSWEFWCDKEARQDFESAAEKDASGSAAGAIGLYRSASRRIALGVKDSLRRSSSQVRINKSTQNKRVPLSRANTTQNVAYKRTSESQQTSWHTAPKLKQSATTTMIRTAGDDSDKENVSPDRDGSSAFDPEADAEVSSFMRSNRMRPSAASDEDEMDVVQGLLSLSQGNWGR